MESSSEDSFTWTDTSDDSIDNNCMAADDNVTDSVLPNTGMHSKHVKKQESKISSSNCNKQVKIEKVTSKNQANYYDSLKTKMVKSESESESDICEKKKKIKHIEMNDEENDPQVTSASYDESYLELKVKQEEMSTSLANQNKKKRNQSYIDINDSRIIDVKYKNNSSDSQNIGVGHKSKKKKKKSKKRNDSGGRDEILNDFKMDIVETDIAELKQSDKSCNNSFISNVRDISFSENNTFQDDSGCGEISAIQCDGDDNHHNISSSDNQITHKESKKKNGSLFRSIVNNNQNETLLSQTREKRAPRLSDRIRFEDEQDSETDFNYSHINKEDKTSSKLRKFVKTNSNMKLVSQKLQQNTVLSHDDEIWIVKCPKDFDIQTFNNIDLNMHGKCKIKLGGQTYDGTMETEPHDTTTTLSMKNNTFELDNLPLYGIINFRKRIPKAHFRDDNIMVNNQTNFIPLPETKCRHPLFGSNYKKALKIPAAVADRLNGQNNVEVAIPTEKKKKKKHKKETIQELEETVSKSELESNVCQELTRKKKKKRKHAGDEEEPAQKKVKRMKHDPDSAEAWESEKAIEQSLFNF